MHLFVGESAEESDQQETKAHFYPLNDIVYRISFIQLLTATYTVYIISLEYAASETSLYTMHYVIVVI